MASVVFKSRSERYRVLLGPADSRTMRYAEFNHNELVTEDPVVIEALLVVADKRPTEVWLHSGRSICPICYKVCKDDFGLNGHMRSHKDGEGNDDRRDGPSDAAADQG